MLSTVTPLLLTYNELPNIERTLAPLVWAQRIVVVDSGSDDGTVEALREHPNVEVFHREFDAHAAQWSFGLSRVDSDWILALDADHVCSATLAPELIERLPRATEQGLLASFVYCVFGKRLRGSLYPPRPVLFRRGAGRFVQDGHTQRLEIDGAIGRLRSPILHDDRKPLTAWLAAQHRYAYDEAVKLTGTPRAQLGRVDRARLRPFLVPVLTPFYCLLRKGLLLDGMAGLYYAGQRTYAELLLSLRLLELRTEIPTA